MLGLILGGAAFQNTRAEAAERNAILDELPEGYPDPKDWTKKTPVRLYDGQDWVDAIYGDVKVGNEFVVDDYLFYVWQSDVGRVTSLKPQVDTNEIEEVTLHYDPERASAPEPDDVVYVIKSPDPEQEREHWTLKNVKSGSEVNYYGRIFAWEDTGDGVHFQTRATGNVFARVLEVHEERHEDDILELIVRFETCGKNGRIVGSEEHPFYVLDVENYVYMVNLEPGMRLKTDNGTLAEVISLRSIPGPMTLYNLTVEHTNNFYIYPEEGQPGILVHNTGGKCPTGLIGGEFEDFLTDLYGGRGSFKVEGREFDGAFGSRWWEAKSGRYWERHAQPGAGFDKFKSDIGAREAIARRNGATLEVHSNTPIPNHAKN